MTVDSVRAGCCFVSEEDSEAACDLFVRAAGGRLGSQVILAAFEGDRGVVDSLNS